MKEYIKHSYFSNPGEFRPFMNDLPGDVPGLVLAVQNLMIHPMEEDLYGMKFSSNQVKGEEQLRTAEQIIGAILKNNPESLTVKRDNRDKIIGICRDHTLLLVSFLREKEIPARARVGFASYFDSDLENECHWVAEYYNDDREEWVKVDSQLDKVQIDKHSITIDPMNVKEREFFTAGEAWVESIQGGIKPQAFGFNKKWRGWPTLKSSLIQDFLCLNSIEPLAWDFWGTLSKKEFSKLSRDEKSILDSMASFTSASSYGDIKDLYFSLDLKDEVESSMKLLTLNSVDRDITDRLGVSFIESLQEINMEKTGDSVVQSELNSEDIVIRGARQNNLKGIDITIPKNKFTVVTGVSGSGKSSLAFDTVYAEGRRRYMASLSTYARRFVDNIEKPDLDHITGVHPAIAIEQKSISRNPRSTVGSISEVYDYLRVLFSQLGTPHCPVCGDSVEVITSGEIASKLCSQERIADIKVDGLKIDLNSITEDSLMKILDREFDSKGYFIIKLGGRDFKIVRDSKCSSCGIEVEKLNPGMFNQNSIDGSCPECSGLGENLEVDPEKIVGEPDKSLLDGASSWFGKLRNKRKSANWMVGEMYALAEYHGVDLNKTWLEYPEEFKKEVLYGSSGRILNWDYSMGKAGRTGTITRAAVGAIYNINRLLRGSSSEEARERLGSYLKKSPCKVCRGEKIGPLARVVTLGRKRFPETTQMTISEVSSWLSGIGNSSKVIKDLISDLGSRLNFLMEVGLHYLTLDRSAPTLSGGEGQRIRLATQLGSGLSGILYVLDEPSVGLHPRDYAPLINSIKELTSNGNTVLVVEHNRETMLEADTIIDIGPGAGIHGGEIVSYGTPQDIIRDINSLTGTFLKGDNKVREYRDRDLGKRWLKLKGATLNNLKGVDLAIPLGNFVGISGVSGSGKSSLVSKTLVPVVKGELKEFYSSLSGEEHIKNLVNVTQEPIGRTPRSNPATYVDILDPIRVVFAGTDDAKRLKLDKKYFSFNSKLGACPECGGLGKKKVEMSFMPDSYITCPDCQGRRYNRKVLEVKWNGYSIADILEMDVNESEKLFRDNKDIGIVLKTLQDVGLGYIKLGQNALTFSGGEAQRIKLAKELCKQGSNNLYILDEPTTGLHFVDVKKLISLLQRLTDSGNTVVVIEHNMDLLSSTDWIIDLGPEGGDHGGYIIAQGRPKDISNSPNSITGNYLLHG